MDLLEELTIPEPAELTQDELDFYAVDEEIKDFFTQDFKPLNFN